MEELNLTKAKAIVDEIVTRLETHFTKFNISEIWKAGSMGHGTAVPGKYDIDLVLYSRDINAAVVNQQNGFHYWTVQLQEFIEIEFQTIRTELLGYNHRSVQFKFHYQGVELDVDLLASPYWDTPREFYQFLRPLPRERRDMFSICASKWQIQFFDRVDSKAKEYIRRAKAWRNRVWESNPAGRPSSFLMSLLVFRAYETANKNYGPGPREVTSELISLVRSPSLNVFWEGQLGEGRFYMLAEYSDLLPPIPRVIDPANPTNNVWRSGIHGGDSSYLIGKIDTINLS